jgi:hypothetical protein
MKHDIFSHHAARRCSRDVPTSGLQLLTTRLQSEARHHSIQIHTYTRLHERGACSYGAHTCKVPQARQTCHGLYPLGAYALRLRPTRTYGHFHDTYKGQTKVAPVRLSCPCSQANQGRRPRALPHPCPGRALLAAPPTPVAPLLRLRLDCGQCGRFARIFDRRVRHALAETSNLFGDFLALVLVQHFLERRLDGRG